MSMCAVGIWRSDKCSPGMSYELTGRIVGCEGMSESTGVGVVTGGEVGSCGLVK